MSILIIILIAVVIGAIIWFASPSALGSYLSIYMFGKYILLAVYAVGLAVGISLTTVILRRLGRSAKRSLFASTLFHKITRYRATTYNIQQQCSTPNPVIATAYGDADDYENLVDILQRQLKFPSLSSKEAAKYAIETTDGKPFQDKILEALKYLDGTNHPSSS